MLPPPCGGGELMAAGIESGGDFGLAFALML